MRERKNMDGQDIQDKRKQILSILFIHVKKAFQPASLRTLILTINLIVLGLPLLGLAGLRIFETVLHRQSEAKLISEGAYVQALYLARLNELKTGDTLDPALYRILPRPPSFQDENFHPYFPTVDMAKNQVLPAAAPGKPALIPPHPAAVLAGTRITPLLQEVQLKNLSGVRVLDVNGVVVATTRTELGEDLSSREEVRVALEGRYSAVMRERHSDSPAPSWDSISRASRVRIFVAIPMLEGRKLFGVVYLSRTSLSLWRDLFDSRHGLLLALLIVITLVISLFVSYLAVHPMKVMVRQAEKIAGGAAGVSLEVGGLAPREAHQLSESLQTMVNKMEQRMAYIEEFTRNVSHEFKTPLASIQGAIELLREGWPEMTEAERSRFLAMIDEDVHRMDRLVRRLLELARIEMAAPTDETTELCSLLVNLARRYQEAGSPVTLLPGADSVPARIAPDLAETLFVNLLDNAVTHGKNTPVTIALQPGPAVSVKDHGPGISPANLPRVFDRFFTTNRGGGGTGLGLAMVKAIVSSCGGRIEVKSDENGTEFVVSFQGAEKARSGIA